MAKIFKFNKEFKGTKIKIPIDDELKIEFRGVEDCVIDKDGYAIFEVDSDMAREYGEVIESK